MKRAGRVLQLGERLEIRLGDWEIGRREKRNGEDVLQCGPAEKCMHFYQRKLFN